MSDQERRSSIPQLLSVARAAEFLDCSAGHVYRLISLGELRAVEIKATGKKPKTRIREEDLVTFIESRTRSTRPASGRPDPRPDLFAGMAESTPHEVYTTTQAARHAEVTLGSITQAIGTERLHATRATERGRWRIEAQCLAAWLDDRPCPHQLEDGGGDTEVRHVDGM